MFRAIIYPPYESKPIRLAADSTYAAAETRAKRFIKLDAMQFVTTTFLDEDYNYVIQEEN